MTGVHQAAARGGAAAPGNPAAAAAPGAGHVTGNAPPLSHSQATGAVPPLSWRTVVTARAFDFTVEVRF